MSKRIWITIALTLLLGVLLSACAPGAPERTPIPTLAPRQATPALADALLTPPAPPADAQDGGGETEAVDLDTALALYETNCQVCHGAMGKEGAVGPSLFANADLAEMPDAEVRDILVNGVEGTAMAAYADRLSEAEIGRASCRERV